MPPALQLLCDCVYSAIRLGMIEVQTVWQVGQHVFFEFGDINIVKTNILLVTAHMGSHNLDKMASNLT